jgi:hypothetical protein
MNLFLCPSEAFLLMDIFFMLNLYTLLWFHVDYCTLSFLLLAPFSLWNCWVGETVCFRCVMALPEIRHWLIGVNSHESQYFDQSNCLLIGQHTFCNFQQKIDQ